MKNRYIEQSWLYYKGQNSGFNFEEFILIKISIPLLSLILYCMIASFGFQTKNLTYWVIGNSFLQCTGTCVFTLGSTFNSEREYGRLRTIIVSPSNKLQEILLKGLFPMIEALISVLFGFIVGTLIFHISLKGINLLLFLIITFVSMFSACGFGLLLGMFGMISSEMNLLLNCMSFVLAILTGSNFPISMLPIPVQFITKFIPLTRSIKAANLLFKEYSLQQIIWLLVGELVLGVIYYVIAFTILKITERIAVKNATLEIF